MLALVGDSGLNDGRDLESAGVWGPPSHEEPLTQPFVAVRNWKQQFPRTDPQNRHPGRDQIINRPFGQTVTFRNGPLGDVDRLRDVG